MRRESRLFVEDMLKSARRIMDEAAGVNLSRLQTDLGLQETVLWNLHVIGEAVRNIPVALRAQYGFVEWRKAAAMRNKVIHDYFGIDWEIVLDTICEHLPHLVAELDRLLAEMSSTTEGEQ